MANLAQTAVVVNDVWKEGGTSSRRFKAVDATLTLTGQGGLTNLILAALFGMSKIVQVRNARNASSVVYEAVPSYSGASVVLSPAAIPTLAQYVATGVNGAGNITVTGVATADKILAVSNIGGSSAYAAAATAALANYTIGSANTVAQAVGGGDTSTSKLLFTVAKGGLSVPTDVTDTVRLIVVGFE